MGDSIRRLPRAGLALILTVSAMTIAGASLDISSQPKPKWKKRTEAVQARMSLEARYRSFFFDQYSTSRKLIDRQESISIRDLEIPPAPAPAAQVFRHLACSSDAVFLGTVIGWETHPTADGTFLFTDYLMRVDDDIRLPRSAGFEKGDTLVLSRPGGAVMVEDIKVEAAVNTFRPLLKGLQYVVFASYRAHVRSFVSEDSWGTFSIVGRHFVSHGNMPLSDMNLAMRRTDSDAFIKALKDGWAFC